MVIPTKGACQAHPAAAHVFHGVAVIGHYDVDNRATQQLHRHERRGWPHPLQEIFEGPHIPCFHLNASTSASMESRTTTTRAPRASRTRITWVCSSDTGSPSTRSWRR